MRIVMTCGVFDLFHEGHQNLLKEMAKRGDLVLVILHDGFTTFANKKKLPIENMDKRTRNLIDTGMVDIIMHTYEKEPHRTFEEVIRRYSRKFELLFVRGDDWKSFPGIETLIAGGTPIEYIPYTRDVSSSKLRNEL